MPQCQRCGKRSWATVRSLFGDVRLCPACSEAERKQLICPRPAKVVDSDTADRTAPGLAGPGKDGINFYR